MMLQCQGAVTSSIVSSRRGARAGRPQASGASFHLHGMEAYLTPGPVVGVRPRANDDSAKDGGLRDGTHEGISPCRISRLER